MTNTCIILPLLHIPFLSFINLVQKRLKLVLTHPLLVKQTLHWTNLSRNFPTIRLTQLGILLFLLLSSIVYNRNYLNTRSVLTWTKLINCAYRELIWLNLSDLIDMIDELLTTLKLSCTFLCIIRVRSTLLEHIVYATLM